jgi:hypothetical protein
MINPYIGLTISKEHLQFNKLLIVIRDILNKQQVKPCKDILYKSLQPCFTKIEENEFKEKLWYFLVSENMKDWIMIDLFETFNITQELIKGFINNIQDQLYNNQDLSDKKKDFICLKICKIFNKFYNNKKYNIN